MQNYKKLDVKEALKDSLPAMQKTIDTVASHFSGTAFPITDLYVGMHCYRTDEKKEYVLEALTEDGTPTWRIVSDVKFPPGGVAKQDDEGNIISKTYARKDELPLLRRNKAYTVGDIAFSPNLPSYMYLECVTAGTTGDTEPDFTNVTSGG